MADVLIIDDDRAIVRTLRLHLNAAGHQVRSGGSLAEGRAEWAAKAPDLIILDLKLPDGEGLELLADRPSGGAQTPVVMITGHHEMENAALAMKAGAYDYIHKPLDLDELDAVITKILTPKPSRPSGTDETGDDFPLSRIVGQSRAVLEIHKLIGLAARGAVTVLITGESGTGKELVARAIHDHSAPVRPFIAVNCSAIVPTLLESELFGHERGAFTGAVNAHTGKMELAADGTLFLDEIGDLQTDLQAKLLRVLQERSFTRVGGEKALPLRARVIAATNSDLLQLVSQKKLREDLYYRLNVLAISIPPLRERCEDIPILAKALLSRICRELRQTPKSIADDDMAQLVAYHWPGNVRELENILTVSAVHSPGEILRLVFKPVESAVTPAAAGDDSLNEVERRHIASVLHQTGWKMGEACAILGISRPTLRKKIKDYGLEKGES